MAMAGGRDTLNMSMLLSSDKLLEHLFRFITQTKRFEDTLGDMERVQ
jgi:hypothetical protein